jgi:hypothetical protein
MDREQFFRVVSELDEDRLLCAFNRAIVGPHPDAGGGATVPTPHAPRPREPRISRGAQRQAALHVGQHTPRTLCMICRVRVLPPANASAGCVSAARANILTMQHDWFADLTGFRETSYELTRSRLAVEGDELVSSVNAKRYGIGSLTLPTLARLRIRVEFPAPRRSTVRCVTGDVRAMHADPEFERALFQVASQFNLLEMTGPNVTPEDGVTRYSSDHTQGPACAIAAGAATIYRNYFVPVDGESGQTRERQLNALLHVGEALSMRLERPVSDLWTMRNGYALCTENGLGAIAGVLEDGGEELRDELRAWLAVGIHTDVEVTDVREGPRRLVSQAFCSAMPVAYSSVRSSAWEAFARLALEAAYEATLLAAVDRVSNIVLLTRLGGGAFGNADKWIDDAILRALAIVEHAGLDIRLVSHGRIHDSNRAIAERFNG